MPIFHFTTKSFQHPESTEKIPLNISSFVVPGQLLITLPETLKGEDAESEKKNESTSSTQDPKKNKKPDIEFIYGEGVEIDEDKNLVFSTRYGYPEFRVNSSSGTQSYFISVTPLIDINQNKMEATISVYPPVKDEGVVDQDKITSALEHLRISYGVDEEAIHRVLNEVIETGLPVTDSIIARGRAPIHGKDASLRFEIEIGPIAGKELANGSIDFRERRMFVAVDENQLIATKNPRTKGTIGINIFGDEISPVEGKDIPIQVSDDARYLEEEGIILSTAPGIVSIVNDNSIRVSSKQKIDGNIDFSTGNIRSQNAVEIAGSILPDFQVACKGDLVVGENIDCAIVSTQSTLVVKGGIIGRDVRVRVHGDADISYIERGQLIARGNVVLRSNAYYADVQVGGDLLCPDNVKLVGGTIIVGGSILVGQVGSDTAEPMTIAVGVNPRRFKRYNELNKEYFEYVQQLQGLSRRHGKLNNDDEEISAIREHIQDLEQDLTALNLVSEASEMSFGDKSSFLSSAELKVEGLIAAGTTVMIGNEIKELEKNYNNVRLYMSPKSGEIEITDLE